MHSYDVIVVGLGAIGTATVYQLSKKYPSLSILGIDQYTPPHHFGSTHGETRIFKLANREGDYFVSLARRSLALWKEIEKQTNGAFGTLFQSTGGVCLSPELPGLPGLPELPELNNKSWSNEFLDIAIKHQIPHEKLSHEDYMQKYGNLVKLPARVQGYHEFGMGLLHPENCIRAQLQLAGSNGAQFRNRERLLSYKLLPKKGIEITTDYGTLEARSLVLAVGPWVKETVEKPIARQFTITRQVSFWFEVEEYYTQFYQMGHFPISIMEFDRCPFVWFPVSANDNRMKVIYRRNEEINSIYHANHSVTVDEVKHAYENFVRPYLKGVSNRCCKAEVCFYTETSNGRFIIDYLPGFDQNVILASACSGHAFKHAPAIGELVCSLVARQVEVM